jgi:hypothetical protein
MTDSEQIQILLKEYETLRTEILHCSNQRFSFLTIGGGVATFTLFKAVELAKFQIFVLIFAAISLCIFWFQLGRLIGKCANRTSEIEEEINKLSGTPLLKWETTRNRSFFRRIHG